MADAEARKILKGVWASDSGAITQDPESSTPVITRTVGYPASFQTTDTLTTGQMNQHLRELYSAANDLLRNGAPLAYDNKIDYPVGAHVKTVSGTTIKFFVALLANGPSTTVVAPPATGSSTTWQEEGGAAAAPEAAGTPSAVASDGELLWGWLPGDNNNSAITSWDFQFRQQGTSTWSASVSRVLPFYQQTGLVNATTYEARVRAVNSEGNGAWSGTGSATPVASAPGGGAELALRADAGDTEVVASWLAPPTGGSPILRYRLQWKSGTQQFGSSRERTGTNLSETVTGLTNGTVYDFRVRAETAAGNGNWSAVAQATPREVQSGIVAPEFPDATVVAGNGTLAIIWEPQKDGGAAIVDWRVRFRENGTTTWTNRSSSKPYLVLTGLTNGTAYDLQVSVRNAANPQLSSTWYELNDGTPVAGVPDAPGTPTLINTATGIRVITCAPARNNGAAITSYRIEYTSAGSSFASNVFNSDANNTDRIITGLSEGTTYHFRVRCTNSAGNSAWSGIANLSFNDGQGVPTVPSGLPTGTAVGGDSILWTWPVFGANGSPITSYDLQWRIGVDPWSGSNVITGIDFPAYRHTGLTAGSTYDVRIRATNANGTSAWSAASAGVIARGSAPSAPAKPVVKVIGRAIQVESDTPKDNGEKIANYDFRFVKQVNLGMWDVVASTTTPGNGEISWTNSPGQATYTMYINRYNKAGQDKLNEITGAHSNYYHVDNAAWAIESVDVSALPVINVGPINFRWSTGSQPAVGATIDFWTDDTTTTTRSDTGPEGCYTELGVAGDRVNVQVRAKNTAGASAWSPPTYIQIPNYGDYFQRTTYGNDTFTWPWDTSRALLRVDVENAPSYQGRPDLAVTLPGSSIGYSATTATNAGICWAVETAGASAKALAINLNTGALVPGNDIDLTAASSNGTWHEGFNDNTTVWFIDAGNLSSQIAYAWTISTRARDSGKDINLSTLLSTELNAISTATIANARQILGGCSDGSIAWVQAAQSTTAWAIRLSDRTRLSARDITFGTLETGLEINGLACDGTFVWSLQDERSSGGNRAQTRAFCRRAANGAREGGRDIIMAGLNPQGLTASGDYVWTLQYVNSIDYLVPFSKQLTIRDSTKDIRNLDSGTADVDGVVSDGTTTWVVFDNNARAFVNSSGARDSSKDITLSTATEDWGPATYDGTYLYFMDRDQNTKYLRAWRASDRSRAATKDITLPSVSSHSWSGVFCDGTTIYVVDTGNNNVKAYTASTGAANTQKDFALGVPPAETNRNWESGASDGTYAWIFTSGTWARCFDLSNGARVQSLDIPLQAEPGVWVDADFSNGVLRFLYYAAVAGSTFLEAYDVEAVELTIGSTSYNQSSVGSRTDVITGLVKGTTTIALQTRSNKLGVELIPLAI